MTTISKAYVVSHHNIESTIEISSPNLFHDKYLNQTDDVDIQFQEFLQNRTHRKIYTIKTPKEQIQNSQTIYFHISIAIYLY